MATISTSFTAVGSSAVLRAQQENENITIAISGTYDMVIRLERAVTSDESAWETLKVFNTEDATEAFVYRTLSKGERFRLTVVTDNGGTAVTTLSDQDEIHRIVKDFNGDPLYTIRESGMLIHKRPQHDDDVGTVGTGVTAVHYSADGINFTSILTLTNIAFTIGDTASLADGALIYTMPAGDIAIKGSAISVGLTLTTGTPTTDTPEIGLGTVIGSGAVAVLSTTLEDIMEGSVMADVAGTAEAFMDQRAMDMLAANAHTIHLNIADAWADVTDAAATADGTVVISWSKLPLA